MKKFGKIITFGVIGAAITAIGAKVIRSKKKQYTYIYHPSNYPHSENSYKKNDRTHADPLDKLVMSGSETDISNQLFNRFRTEFPSASEEELNETKELIQNSIYVLKRLDENTASNGIQSHMTWIKLSKFIANTDGFGEQMVDKLDKLKTTSDDKKTKNKEIVSWFRDLYFKEESSVFQNATKLGRVIDSKIDDIIFDF